MKELIKQGKVIEYTVPESETVTSGQAVVMGSLVGFAITDGAEDDVVNVAICGVFDGPKSDEEEIEQGALLYYNTETEQFTTEATREEDGDPDPVVVNNIKVGFAHEAAAEEATSVSVNLNFI
jgi:predicted RecA/RadA family phage recombinase